ETSAEFASSLQHSEAPPSSRRSKCGLVSKMARSCNCSSVTPAFLPTAELISELELVMALPVEKLMTSEVETCSPEDAIVEFMLVLEGTASDLRVMIAGERRSGDVDAEHHHVPRQ